MSDSTTGNTYYPHLLLNFDCETTDLLSVDAPETEYRINSAYDMEGSAFFGSACRFATSELVQIVKIVSDNSDHSMNQISKQTIQTWVKDNLTIIADVVGQLDSISAKYNSIYSSSDEFLQLADKVHLTSSQRVQLHRLVSRFRALGGSELQNRLNPESYKSAKSLLNNIELLVQVI